MLTKDQEFILDKIMFKLRGESNENKYNPNFKYITIGGLAGTGKTYLISEIRKEIYNLWKHLSVAFIAFTGKASSVLNSKLSENNSFFYKDNVSTIHSLIYKPEVKYDSKIKQFVIVKWIKKEELEYDLIIVDEASMINQQIWKDLLEYEIPIIAVGDHGQLPPIGDGFSLMTSPHYILTEIKRQALNNPIIRLSLDIRNGVEIPDGFYDPNYKGVFKGSWKSDNCRKTFDSIDFLNDDTIILCGKNRSRVMINQMVRNKLGFTNYEPYPGERVIFLRNNYNSHVFNGMLGKTLFFLYEAKNIYDMTVLLDGFENPYSGLVFNGCFGQEDYGIGMSELQDKKYYKVIKKSNHSTIDLCDYGYCISTHKSQGSEFKKVVCFIEKSYYWDEEYMKKWLYTAVTRAKEKLFLITDFN